MTVIKINAITVPEDSGTSCRAVWPLGRGRSTGQEGFEGFELLNSTDGRAMWLVAPAGATRRRSRPG